MANPVKPYTFVEDTDAEADQVNANFDALFDWVNNSAIHADASKPFTAIPSGPNTDPSNGNQFARKHYVDTLVQGVSSSKVLGLKTNGGTDFNVGSSVVLIPGMSVTTSYTAGHVYRITGYLLIQFNSGNGATLTVQEGATQIARLYQNNQDNSAHTIQGQFLSSTLSGTRTFSLGAASPFGTFNTLGAKSPGLFMVEDLGVVQT